MLLNSSSSYSVSLNISIISPIVISKLKDIKSLLIILPTVSSSYCKSSLTSLASSLSRLTNIFSLSSSFKSSNISAISSLGIFSRTSAAFSSLSSLIMLPLYSGSISSRVSAARSSSNDSNTSFLELSSSSSKISAKSAGCSVDNFLYGTDIFKLLFIISNDSTSSHIRTLSS